MLEKYLSEKLFRLEFNRGVKRWDTFTGTEEQLDELNDIINPYLSFLHNMYGRELSPLLEDIVIKDNRVLYILHREYPKEKLQGMTFYTLCPLERLDISEDNINKAKDYINFLCTDLTGVRQIHYVFESGKYKDKPNLHCHLLVKFYKGGSKNFSRQLKIKWSKVFIGSSLDYNIKGNVGVDSKACNTIIIQKDKLDYMENELKGSHENFTDLKLRGMRVYEGS